MSEQESNIIGYDMDGKPIPDGATVRQDGEVKPRAKGVTVVVTAMPSHVMTGVLSLIEMLAKRDGRGCFLYIPADGHYVLSGDVRLVKDDSKDDEQQRTDHTPADEDFQADLQQWLAGSKQESKSVRRKV